MSEVKKETKTKKASEVKKETKVKSTKKKVEAKEVKPAKVVKTKKSIKEEVLLNEKDQHRYSTLCKIIRIITKIGRICLMILVPFIFIFMILVPFFFKNVNIESNIIKVDQMSIILQKDNVSFKVGDEISTFYCDQDEISRIVNFLNTHSNEKIVFLIESFLLTLGIVVVLEIYLLNYFEKLFTNLENNKVPFTEENTGYILKICKVLLALKLFVLLMSILDFYSSSLTSISVIEILVSFTIYYLFKYATAIQSKTTSKICD